jgi:hypothetical protein
LPGDYVERLVEELSDHAADLLQENPAMDAERDLEMRLGTPEQLASTAAAEFRRRSFAGRHPILTFIGGPFVAILATLVAIVATMFFVGEVSAALVDLATDGGLEANEAARQPPSDLEMGLMRGLSGVVRFVPFILSGWLFARLAGRSGLRLWGAAACGIVAVGAFCFWSAVGESQHNGMGYWMLGFGWRPGIDQFVQAVVPAALAAWLAWQALRPTEKTLAAG